MSLESSSLQTLIDNALAATPLGYSVGVALSGGLDSSLLLTLAARANQQHGRHLKALHVHHGLQPAADDFEHHCRSLCDSLGVPLHVERVTVDPANGEGLEGAARRARYAAFQRCLEAGDILWLAQHRDDQAETFILAALRGAGGRGLAGMPQRHEQDGVDRQRPLLGISRAAMEAEAVKLGVDWIEDPSNAETHQDRNFLRHRIMPVLAERWLNAEASLARSAELAGEADGLLDEFAAEDLARLGDTPACLSVEPLMMFSAARCRLLIRHCLSRLGLSRPPSRRLDSLLEQLDTRRDAEVRVDWAGAEARVWRKTLYLMPPLRTLPADWCASWSGQAPLVTPLGEFCMALACDAGPLVNLTVTPRRGGERLALPRRGERDLKRLLQEQAIPPWERARCWVVWQGQHVVAVGYPGGWLALADGWQTL